MNNMLLGVIKSKMSYDKKLDPYKFYFNYLKEQCGADLYKYRFYILGNEKPSIKNMMIKTEKLLEKLEQYNIVEGADINTYFYYKYEK